MADAALLEEKRKDSGKTKSFLAKKLGVSRPYLYKLMQHPETCTVGQAEAFCSELDIKKKNERDTIFLP